MRRIYLTAEVGQAHDGSLGILHSYIDAIAETGADAVKFQMHIADAESSDKEPFRVRFGYEDKTRMDYWRRVGFTRQQWVSIKQHCEKKKLEFIASPFSVEAVRFLETLGVKKHKIASGQIQDFLMLDAVVKTGKEIWISTGMSHFREIEETLKFINYPKQKIVLFQCTSAYPTKPEQIGLNIIEEYRRRFGVRVGFSDHSGNPVASLAAILSGADFIEAHVVFDKRMFGPDSKASLTLGEFKFLVESARFVEKMVNHPVDKSVACFPKLKKIFGKSLALKRALQAGEKISIQDLESKKPAGCGIASKDFRRILGKSAKRTLSLGSFIQKKDIQ